MSNKRLLFCDRRHNNYMLIVPFKDSHGSTIRECRRRTPDRRLNNIQAEWFDESD